MQATPYQLTYYTDETGDKPFKKWLYGLRDRAAFARITTRLARVEIGNVGDYKNVGSGVFELRIHYGPGYRVYYGHSGNEIVLLLLGGDKTTQAQDIATAATYWKHYRENKTCDQ